MNNYKLKYCHKYNIETLALNKIKMKKILIITGVFIVFLSTGKAGAQIAIGKTSITNPSVLFEFGTDPEGIILPSVQSAPGSVGGTFIFNASSRSVQVLEDTSWKNLTDENQGINHSFSNAGTDNPGATVIIGASSTNKPGALVLESSTKAMVLPLVANPHLTMKGAIAGTIVYDTAADMLAVYDGSSWSYWK